MATTQESHYFSGGSVNNESIKGKWSVFFFYPADFTFVCSTELGDLAFRFRIYPNEVQTNLILQTFGCTRFVYNKILAKAQRELSRKVKFSSNWNKAKLKVETSCHSRS